MTHPKHPYNKPSLERDRRYVSLRLKVPCVRGYVSEILETLEGMMRICSEGPGQHARLDCQKQTKAHEVAR